MKRIASIALVVLFALSVSQGFSQEEYLSAIGGLGASNLYVSFLTIGMLGDAFEYGVYQPDTVKDILGEVISLNKASRASLDTLVKEGHVTGEDRATVLEMIQAHSMLEKQAGELLKYAEDKKLPNDFQFYRKKSWELISNILGIPQK
ncbi:MAG: hypothetical protein N2442_06935 [Spirochaetes bacterium]|nr:hypothetical protein [Spirochaetota bacterium]